MGLTSPYVSNEAVNEAINGQVIGWLAIIWNIIELISIGRYQAGGGVFTLPYKTAAGLDISL